MKIRVSCSLYSRPFGLRDWVTDVLASPNLRVLKWLVRTVVFSATQTSLEAAAHQRVTQLPKLSKYVECLNSDLPIQPPLLCTK